MLRRVSLANKCLLLFGLAVVLIILAALAVPWVRMNRMVDDAEFASARQVISAWEALSRRAPDTARSGLTGAGALAPGDRLFLEDTRAQVVSASQAEQLGKDNPAILEAWRTLADDPARPEYTSARWGLTARAYVLARPLRETPAQAVAMTAAGAPMPPPMQAMLVLTRTSAPAAREMLQNTGFLLSAGCVALGLAVLVFYLITSRIILSPVRRLRETAEIVRGGNLDLRSDIHTGDEFEELAESFNDMLTAVQSGQTQLRALNAQLDDKLTELEQRNSALADATRLKGDFLANVTHELRTPLNSIIGFAELLDEQAQRETDAQASPEALARLAKRRRYIDNINAAGRALLELINGLLEMARVEAGKVQMIVSPVNLREHCDTMLAMMKPVADKRSVELRIETPGAEDLPLVHTDARKLQQVLYNLMSNAIKFTADAADAKESQMAAMDPEAAAQLSRIAVVTLRAEHLPPRAAEGPEAIDRVRVSVLDTGPGIAPADQQRIFDKFTQLDAGLGRKHAGTGLGLSIVKELCTLLQGEVHVTSELGRGAMFSVILPVRLDPARAAEVRLEQSLRGALAPSRA